MAALLVGVTAPAATAAPAGSSSTATTERERIEQQLAAAEEAMARATVEAEAAGDAARAAQAELSAAQSAADSAAAELASAEAAVARARGEVADLGRAAFMGSDPLADAAALLDAAGPDEALQRAATLDLLGEDRAARLSAFEDAQVDQEAAGRAARLAVRDREAAARAAAEAETAAQDQLRDSREAYDRAAAELGDLEGQLGAAGVATPSAQLRTTGQGLVAGRVTSCFGSRSGANHNGVDIAAPIGTPIYAPDGGVVLYAGTANGFGYAIYLQHPDGTITVYGHINQYLVSTGQVVSAGDQIAEVGNRGQSTGPHLHIETHTGGLFANRVNPVPWLAARGISLGCG